MVGTGTGVGKTVLSVLLTRRLIERGQGRVAALKPLCSGGRGDVRHLRAAAENVLPLDTVNPWHFREALSPAVAARRAGRPIRGEEVVEAIRRVGAEGFDLVVVEGAGGLLSPLAESFDGRDLLVALRATPLLVASNRLGVLNDVFLSWEALPARLRARATVVVMEPARADRASRTNVPVLMERLGEPSVVVFPFVPDWQAIHTKPLPARVRKALDQVADRVPA